MHPASSRASRSKIRLQVGPVAVSVDVYSGTYKAPSPTKVCVGSDTAAHTPTKLKSGASNPARCSLCEGGTVKTARPGEDGKLVVVQAEDMLAALEASEEHRDTMPLIRVPFDVLAGHVLESADIYWLPESGEPSEIYAGLVAVIAESQDAIITRWSPQKNVNLYRLVSRHGLLGMVQLVPAETLRVSPAEPVQLEGDRAVAAKALAGMALGMAPEFTAEQLVEISGNPYTQIIADAAAKAIESGTETVRMSNQNRTTFADNAAATKLAAMLEGAEL